MVIVGLLHIIAYMVASGVISGVTAVIITQLTAAPLRPVKLRVAFGVLRKRWRPFLKTMIRVTLRILLGCLLLFIPGIIIWIRYSLYAPVVLIEGLEKKAAMRRARELASRSWRTIIIVSILQIRDSDDRQFLCRTNQDRNQCRTTLAGAQIYQQSRAGEHLRGAFDLDRAGAALLKMRQLGGESLSAASGQIEEGERRAERVAAAHAHPSQPAHPESKNDHRHLTINSQNRSRSDCNFWFRKWD